MKKFLVVGIVVLFIGITVSSSADFNVVEQSNIPITNGKTLYVGGDGPGNYTKIQDAIDNASNDDTVYVYNGTYYENVVIYKTINLIGEDKDTTVIDAGGIGDVIYISTNGVNISCFTIQNGGTQSFPNYDCGIDIRSNNNTICRNVITNNSRWGILVYYASNNIISENIVSYSFTYGILISQSSNNTIQNSIVANNGYHGIRISSEVATPYISCNNKIFNCSIYSNVEFGIHTLYTKNDIINNCNITDNHQGIQLVSSDSITINACNLYSNKHRNIMLVNSTNTSIYECNIKDSEIGISMSDIVNTVNNFIYNNNFINNKENAYDKYTNTWDNGYLSGGNYWDDYEDRYPNAKPKLLRPWIWNTPLRNSWWK